VTTWARLIGLAVTLRFSFAAEPALVCADAGMIEPAE